MAKKPVTVLGGGNTAFSVAADLSLAGVEVILCEIPSFAHSIEPIRETRQIALDGVANRGTAKLAAVTTDFAKCLAQCELVLLIIPSYGHRAFAKQCAPFLRDGQTVVLMPGNLGCLQFASFLREQNVGNDVVLAETDTAPYVCRKMSPTSAHIWGIVESMGLGVYPAHQGPRVERLLEPLFPGMHRYDHALACGLAAMNPVMHPAGVLLNAGRVEYARGEFYFYEEGVTPGVCNLIYAVDRERLALATAFGLQLKAVDESFHAAGFGPKGDLWATINGSRMLTQLRAPGALETRWLTEDVPYGLATWVLLGEQVGISCPVIRSVVDVASATLQIDFWKHARTPDQLGLAGKNKEEIVDYLMGH